MRTFDTAGTMMLTRRSHSLNPWRAALIAAFVVTAACGQGPLEPLPLDVSVVATPSTAARGDTITFSVTAQGGNLVSIVIDYGDTNLEQISTFGARTAKATFHHPYAVQGAFTVTATVNDADAGAKQTTVSLRVN